MNDYLWLTPAAPAAIALVETPVLPALFSGPIPDCGCVRFGYLRSPDGRDVDEVVCSRWQADRLEFGCHGGPGIRAAVDAALVQHGLHQVQPAETYWGSLARVQGPAAARWLLTHPDEEPPFPSRWLHESPVILLTGPTNAGKSTLLNAWCGHRRSLVSAIAGTTRDLVAAEALIGGWRCRLLDSAGLRAAAGDHIEQAGMELVAAARQQAAVVVAVVPCDGEHDFTPEPGDTVIHSKVDLHATGEVAGLAWAGPEFVGDDRASVLLDDISASVLATLGLPPEVS